MREPEQRFVLVGFFWISDRRLQLVNRPDPLLVGNKILRVLHALRFNRTRVRELRHQSCRQDQGRADSPSAHYSPRYLMSYLCGFRLQAEEQVTTQSFSPHPSSQSDHADE